ncbi:MAG: patatin-like phospholipase family protein [Chloroflexi bacterium]|nr:patatin-like phospholipase family protein [Chloroflexota bacterium]
MSPSHESLIAGDEGSANRGRAIGLALGGGGARGLTHFGVLQVLEEAGIEVRELAGTSAGAICAAGLAVGHSVEELVELARRAPHFGIFRPRPGNGAIAGATQLDDWLRSILGDARIEACPVPLTVVATRARDGAPVFLREGPLVPAVLASAAIPLIFPPVLIDGEYLVDGGVSCPVPEAALSGRWPAVAVDLGPGPIQRRRYAEPDWWPQLEELASRVPHEPLRAGVLGSLRNCILGYRPAQGRLVIRPAVPRWHELNYFAVDDLVARGRLAALEALPALERLLTEPVETS